METTTPAERLAEHLMDQAAQEYHATEFTVLAQPRHGNVGIRFKVQPDTPAKRPTLPPELRPARWEDAVATVVSDISDQLYMTWSWPAGEEHDPSALASMAEHRSKRTGEPIEVR